MVVGHELSNSVFPELNLGKYPLTLQDNGCNGKKQQRIRRGFAKGSQNIRIAFEGFATEACVYDVGF